VRTCTRRRKLESRRRAETTDSWARARDGKGKAKRGHVSKTADAEWLGGNSNH
jgi:hypothetical protein